MRDENALDYDALPAPADSAEAAALRLEEAAAILRDVVEELRALEVRSE